MRNVVLSIDNREVEKYMLDMHVHSNYSSDGTASLEEMIKAAVSRGLKYISFAEHYDYDYVKNNLKVQLTDISAYFNEITLLAEKYADKIKVVKSIELGYESGEFVENEYNRVMKKYPFDCILNSAHIANKVDCWKQEFYVNKSRETAYTQYFTSVLNSINCNYSFDIITHLGIPARYAPYKNNKIIYADWKDILDEILKAVIAKGKTLEINTSAGKAKSEFLPDTDILKRYKELGGEKITFSSDAHGTSRIAEKYREVCQAVSELGFKYFVVYIDRKEKFIKI